MINPLLAQLTHQSFPQLADALRVSISAINREWDAAVRQALPQLNILTFDELKDSIPKILASVADALASSDPQEIEKLVHDAPWQGLTRFHQHYTLTEIMQEDRLLRGVVVVHVEGRLGRQMSVPEAAALHATVDVMLQRAVVALVDEQKAELRVRAEREMKYLSFLSHDLNNNLGGITLMLDLIRQQLLAKPDCSEATEQIDSAQKSIRNTIDGMRRLLDHERLRQGGAEPTVAVVDLHTIASHIVRQYERDAAAKGVAMEVRIEPGTVVRTDPELVTLVLQNLVVNAVKYSSKGTVRVDAQKRGKGNTTRWVLSVSDEGPGIAPEQLEIIFKAFRRGEVHGQEGVGLGLAIASEAAKLLNAELTVKSEVGRGSVFRLSLPGLQETPSN